MNNLITLPMAFLMLLEYTLARFQIFMARAGDAPDELKDLKGGAQ